MKKVFSAMFVLVGLGLAAFAANVALRGAEPELPAAGDSIEGTLAPGQTVRSPVGEPFLYGEVRVQDADNTESNVGTIHFRAVHGEPAVVVRTAAGDRRVTLAAPDRWRVLEGTDATQQVASLEGLPLVGDVDVGDRLSPPFRLSARVVRPGDHVIVAKAADARVPVYVGERAALTAERRRRESGRFPIVVLLAIMSGVSFFVSRRVLAGSVFGEPPPEEE